jgi:ribosomal protein S6
MRDERGLEELQQGYYNALTFTGAQEVIEELKKVRKVS